MAARLLLSLRKKIFHSDAGERKRLRFDLTVVSSCMFTHSLHDAAELCSPLLRLTLAAHLGEQTLIHQHKCA